MRRGVERSVRERRIFGAVVVVSAVAAAVVTRAVALGFRFGVEVLVSVVVLVGSAVAFGLFDRRRRRPLRLRPVAEADLTALADRTLAELDRVEHHHLELSDGGPSLVVGPTGVVVLVTCALPGPLHVTAEGPLSLANGKTDAARWEQLRQLVGQVRRVVADADREVPVRGLAVVAPGTEVSGSTVTAEALSLVPVDVLVNTVARGTLLPMSTVADVFERLTGELAPMARLRS